MKLKDVEQLFEITKELLKATYTNIQASYTLMVLTEQVEKEYDTFVKQRDELVLKHADEGTNSINNTSKNYEEFKKEYDELLEKDSSIIFPKMKLEYFDGVPLNLFQLKFLTNLLESQ